MPSKEADVSLEDGGAGDVLLKPVGDHVTFSNVNNSDGAAVGLPLVEGESPPIMLETEEERKARRRSHYIVYFTTFIGSVGFSIVLIGVWPYIQQLDPGASKEFLGWVIAANPFGQMLTSPLLGLWANKAGSNRGPLLLSVLIFIMGNVLYSILHLFGEAAWAVMVFARFLVGVSFANMAIIRSYVAASTTTKERTTAVALTSAAQGFGFIIGPALQAAIVKAFDKGKEETANVTWAESLEYQFEDEGLHIEWNIYTAAGWAAAFLGIINFFLFLPCAFKEYPIAAKEAQLLKSAANESDTKLPKPDYATVISVLISFFIVQFVFVLIEVLLVPMCADMYAWTDETVIQVIGVGLCVAGLVATIMFGSVGVLARKFDERKIYIFLGLIPLLLAMICFVPMGSTYPKIQNCTTEAALNHRDTRSIATSLSNHLEVIKSRAYSLNYAKIYGKPAIEEAYMIHPRTELPNTFLSNETDILRKVVNPTTLIDVDYPVESFDPINVTYFSQNILSRKKRRLRREKRCRDTGCPPEQEWCFYTPIIEQSQMIVACLIAFIGYPVAFSLSSSLYSKLLGPKPQGVWMGILTSTGSFSRMTGPIFVSYMYTALGTRWTFGFLIVIMVFTTALVVVFFKRMIPMRVTSG